MPKILLVEDNEMNRDMLSRRLLKQGFEMVIAVDGEQAVDLARSEAPDLILMDISLPGLDGWEATRRLKTMPETRSIPDLPPVFVPSFKLGWDSSQARDPGGA
jgi:two-component system cell cycle response regulator DivK